MEAVDDADGIDFVGPTWDLEGDFGGKIVELEIIRYKICISSTDESQDVRAVFQTYRSWRDRLEERDSGEILKRVADWHLPTGRCTYCRSSMKTASRHRRDRTVNSNLTLREKASRKVKNKTPICCWR